MLPTGCRLRPLLRPLISSQSSGSQLQAYCFLSSFSDYQRRLSSDDPEKRSTGSIVYRHALKTQRPSTIRKQKELENSASFIGTIDSPLKTFTTSAGIVCVYTRLKVQSPSSSKKFLTIFLNFWDDMAELSIQHLKPNDYIYVSGYLGSFTRASDNGNIKLYPKIIVKEINYVAKNNQKANYTQDHGESALEKHRKRLYLWQVFFANPYEWQDLRKCKVNPNQPDFKHKDTSEALWLKPHDPKWIFRQLQLQDSKMNEIDLQRHLNSHSNLSTFDL